MLNSQDKKNFQPGKFRMSTLLHLTFSFYEEIWKFGMHFPLLELIFIEYLVQVSICSKGFIYYTPPPYSHEIGANQPPSLILQIRKLMHIEIIACLRGFVVGFITSNLLYYFTSLLLLATVYYRTKSPILWKKKKCMVFE